MKDQDFSEKVATTHVALIHETWRESIARDLSTACTFIALWSLGYWADSAALEWVGVILGFLLLFVRILAVVKRTTDRRMTPDQARAWLDRKFPKEGAT